MPLAIATLTLAVLLGQFAPRRIAMVVIAIAAGLTLTQFVWVVVDGTGDDPWWWIPVGAALAAASVGACAVLSSRRAQGHRP
jgi:hypothetical protein